MSLRNNKPVLNWFLGLLACMMGVYHSGSSQTFSGKSSELEINITDPELADKSVKPTIRWIYPSETVQSVSRENINLKLGVISKSPVVKVTMVVNNEVVGVFDNFTNSDSGYLFDAWIEKTVLLQTGSNDLQLIVQNEQGALKHQRKIEVIMSPSFRKDHALVFGMDEYDSWNNLQGPVTDADRIAKVLEEKGFAIEIVRNSTTFDLLSKLEEYAIKEFHPHDQLFIYFAGHGYYNPASGEGFLVCKNSVNLPNANTTYISYEAIKSIVNNIPAQHIFMLIDAVKGKGEPMDELMARLREQPEDSNRIKVPEGKSRLGIISGSMQYEQGISNSSGSALSRAFINYLKKSEQHETPSWGDLLLEFEHVDPGPIYIEFGDHSTGNGFTFKQAASEN